MMPPVSIRLQRVNWDAGGVGTSTLGVIHCLLLPVVLAFAPTLAHFCRATKPCAARLHIC